MKMRCQIKSRKLEENTVSMIWSPSIRIIPFLDFPNRIRYRSFQRIAETTPKRLEFFFNLINYYNEGIRIFAIKS
ncbi:hypothetical protein WN48_05358 [Eufriesea mexicana]|nr:hypothetical protein WN48_05358 [Eufriesea mexicana]